ncbi:MAG: S-layer homology domain-containing protein, partial [Clostridia bacterium]|nr:S-layer homology domain-containing protein [Clostridia bacterium]
AKRTDTGAYQVGYYGADQRGNSNAYIPQAGTDFVINYDGSYVILEWSIPFSEICEGGAAEAGDSVYLSIGAESGAGESRDADSFYAVSLGDFTYGVATKAAVNHAAFLLSHVFLDDSAGTVNSYTDVSPDAFYYTPVLWSAKQPNIDLDAKDGLFLPNTGGCSLTAMKENEENSCAVKANRGGIMYMLWWLAGCPEPVSTNNPFRDLSSDAYYYKASLWAVEKGITTGTSATAFSPDSSCTKGQIVTFLYRALHGKNYGSYTISFNPEHNYSDWTPVSESTCTESGLESRICPNCGGIETRETEPPLGHDYKDGICVRCGHENTRDFEFNVFDGEARINRYIGDEGNVVVPETLGGYPVTEIGSHAFSVINYVYHGDYYYADNTTLESITLPASLRSISEGAFYGCINLDRVNITDVSAWCNVSFDENPLKIAGNLYLNGELVTDLVIPDGVASVANGAFSGCTSITSVRIPDSTVDIGYRSFADCRNLRNLTIGNGLQNITESAFLGCDGLNRVRVRMYEKDWSKVSIGYDNFPILYAEKEFLVSPVSFTDVPADAYYADAVAWAVANGITTGTSATTFSPNDGCTRGQVVAFLWRAAGSPEPKGTRNPFIDVKPNAYYYEAVLWAVENGVTSGTDATHFSPNSVCTRGQIVTFQWRANGKPQPTETKNPFKDVKSSDYFYTAVLWAVEKGVTTGTDATHFSPSSTCTRGQVVTFLYRDSNS